MPSEEAHIALANRNHHAMMALHVAPDDHPEWLVTIAFYKAVHVIQAALSRENRVCHDHKTRHDVLKRLHPDIWKHYRPLWAASTIARYLYDSDSNTPYTSFIDHCSSDQVYEKFVHRRLRTVEDLTVSKLSSDQREELLRVPG